MMATDVGADYLVLAARCRKRTGLWPPSPRGQLNMRFTYTAGYAAIPEDIQEAVVQASANSFISRGRLILH